MKTPLLLRVQLPTISGHVCLSQDVPAPGISSRYSCAWAFPSPISISFNLGYDTNGFFWNTHDLTTGKTAPLFSFAVQFSIGVGLNFGVVSVSIDLFFRLTDRVHLE